MPEEQWYARNYYTEEDQVMQLKFIYQRSSERESNREISDWQGHYMEKIILSHEIYIFYIY